MSIQDTINMTIDAIQGTIRLAKNTVIATANGVVYVFTHFPQVLSGMWEMFKASLRLGQYFMTLALRVLKNILLNLPEILKGLYELTIEILNHLPEVIRFMGRALKFFLYEVPKAVGKYLIEHLPAVANWFVRHLPDLIAHSVGVIIGIVYAPFKLTFDLLRDGFNRIFEKNNARHPTSRTSTPSCDPIVEGLVVGAVGAALIANSFERDISNIEQQQKTYVPNQQRHRTENHAAPLNTISDAYSYEEKNTFRC